MIADLFDYDLSSERTDQMDIVYRSHDGKEFSSKQDCLQYEQRLGMIVEQLVEVGLVEAKPGTWIAGQLGVQIHFLSIIRLMNESLDVITRRDGAQHLAEHMDSYISLGKWLERVEHECQQEVL
jgi:hypothetical protein